MAPKVEDEFARWLVVPDRSESVLARDWRNLYHWTAPNWRCSGVVPADTHMACSAFAAGVGWIGLAPGRDFVLTRFAAFTELER